MVWVLAVKPLCTPRAERAEVTWNRPCSKARVSGSAARRGLGDGGEEGKGEGTGAVWHALEPYDRENRPVGEAWGELGAGSAVLIFIICWASVS